MLRGLTVALLLVASPALANDPAPAQEYTIKKVCRTVEVSGSFIPRTSCMNKKIPVKKPDTQSQEAARVEAPSADAPAVQKEQ